MVVAFMATTLPALAALSGDSIPTGGPQSPWTCTESAGVVEFRTGSARLSPRAKAALKQIAIWARDDSSRSVRLRGMGGRSGSARVDTKLSERRAKAVQSYLTRQGVDPELVTTTVGHPDQLLKNETGGPPALRVATCLLPSQARAPDPWVAPAVASAPPPSVDLPTAMPASPPAVRPRRPGSSIGIGAMVGGGLTGFVDPQTRAFTNTGPSWDARITIGTRLPIAFEGAYLGSAQNISALGIDDQALIVGNGAEGALRLNLPRMAVQPYVFGGLGWTRYQLRRTLENASSLRGSDDIFTVPFGVGVAARLVRGLLLDLRVTGRAAFYDDLMDDAYASTADDARLHSWNAGGRLGWEF
jgi:hypothetical protein